MQTIKQLCMAIRENVFALVYPKRCPVCDKILNPEEADIHSHCREMLFYVPRAVCMRCGRPIENTSYEFCYNCSSYFASIKKSQGQFVPAPPYKRKKIEPLEFQGKAIFLYKGSMKKSLYRFKYSNKREYAHFFAKEAVRLYGDWIRQRRINLIVPIPMYARKKRKRGYNQAECFAKVLSVLTQIPMDAKLVERVKDTTPQKQLNRQERKNNLKNAFQTRKSIVQYKYRILIVDDIYTTGSTAETVMECLKEAGAESLQVLSIAIGQ
uniref:double zinc ribbon domain-containing protein n=1 Tax=Agathobacter sp. TaxID=2021311 RepID=UPI004057216F